MDLILGIDAVVAAIAATVAFLVCRRDLGTTRATGVALVSALLVAACWMLVLYLALAAFLVAALVYVVLRHRVSVSRAMLVAAGCYAALSVAAAGMFMVALESM